MAGPHIWDVGDNITFELHVVDPTTGLSLTGKVSFITLTVRRDTDGKYWTNTEWSTTRTLLTVNEPSSVNDPGRYIFILPGVIGNVNENRYVGHFLVSNAPIVEGDAFEIHVSRTQDVRIYESEPE